MPYCPRCGKEVTEGAEFCGNCGMSLRASGVAGDLASRQRRSGVGRLGLAVNLASSRPIILVPAVLGGLILPVVDYFVAVIYGKNIAESLTEFMLRLIRPGPNDTFTWLFLLPFLGFLIIMLIGLVSNVLEYASIEMSRDAYLNLSPSPEKSINYVLRRIGTLILASLLVGLLSITIILIPATFLIPVIIIVDETGVRDSLSKAITVMKKELRDVVIITVIAIIGSPILSFTPVAGNLLASCLTVMIHIAFIDIYYSYKQAARANRVQES